MIDLTNMVAQSKTTAIYARVSTKDGRQDAENQLRQLREFCTSQGWTVCREYIDHASGKNDTGRPEFQRLFEDAAQRKFDLVVFWALDRFSREGVLATLQYLQRLSGYGIGYRSFTEGYLDSCGMFKDAVIGILAVVAKQERIRISERVQAGLHRARAAGRVGGRPRGVFDRARVQELRQQGLSIGEIAAEVGVPRTSVHRALKQPNGCTLRGVATTGSSGRRDIRRGQSQMLACCGREGSTRCRRWWGHGVRRLVPHSIAARAIGSVKPTPTTEFEFSYDLCKWSDLTLKSTWKHFKRTNLDQYGIDSDLLTTMFVVVQSALRRYLPLNRPNLAVLGTTNRSSVVGTTLWGRVDASSGVASSSVSKR
jgi:DNA invertase Pin-like site-specific DNA recombinase